MRSSMETSPDRMDLNQLAEQCAQAVNKHRRREPADDKYCLEIFHRAILHHVDEAWTMLQKSLHNTVRFWLYKHPSYDLALRRNTEENYIALTFSRFWYAVRERDKEFETLNAALSYLHATLNAVILDSMRGYARAQRLEMPLPEPGFVGEPMVEATEGNETNWEIIASLLPDARERRVAYLLYHCGLRPREIIKRCAREFSDVKEIYRLNDNIISRLKRNRNRLRWLLGDEEN